MTYTTDAQVIENWGKYGMYTGTAYQIADDIVDLSKLASGDLEVNMENVFGVLPALIHYNKGTVKKLPFMLAMGNAGLMEMLDIVTNADIQPKMRADIDMYVEKARACVPDMDKLHSEHKEILTEYPAYCVSAILSEIDDGSE
jgi:geranylgeranyl pyrophosphate synthase